MCRGTYGIGSAQADCTRVHTLALAEVEELHLMLHVATRKSPKSGHSTAVNVAK